jgi:hypothetical protein
MNTLTFNRILYGLLKKDIYKFKGLSFGENLFHKIKVAANFAFQNFTGILTDFELELFLYQISKNANLNINENVNRRNDNIVLHYVTELYDTGGHTRVIKNWITHDLKKAYLYISTNCSVIPDFIKELDCSIYQEVSDSYLERTEGFINYVNQINPGLIIIHNHPDDLIPTLARPYITDVPFLFFNHSDFSFSLGTAFSDVGISLNFESKKINDKFRFNFKSFVLPLYVNNFELKERVIDKERGLTIIIVAPLHKLIPYKDWDIFNLLIEMNSWDEISIIKVVGISKTQAHQYMPDIPSKVIFLGLLKDTGPLLKSADVYIESIPFGTGLATLEAIALGCFPLFNPTSFLIYNKGAALSYFPVEMTKEYMKINSFEQYKSFIRHKLHSIFLANKPDTSFKEYIYINNKKEWIKYLMEIYSNGKVIQVDYSCETKEIEDDNAINFAELFSKPNYHSILSNITIKRGFLIIALSFYKDMTSIRQVSDIWTIFIKMKSRISCLIVNSKSLLNRLW